MLQTLQLTNIRSYKSGLFEFVDGVNIIVGPNASGKTNLLEAIYMSMRGSAFKSDDLNMIARDCEWGRIDSMHTNEHTRSTKLTRLPLTKTYVIDDNEKKRLTEHYKLPVVLFEPAHMLLLGGEPERRRAYIDNLLTQTEPAYSQLMKSYKRTLAQRNKLLKQEQLVSGDMFVWNIRLADLAGKLTDYRVKYVEFIQQQLTNNYQSVSGNQEVLIIGYDSKLPIEQYTSALLKKLADSFELDHARGFTGSGPHRDDIKITLNNNDVRDSASRGETRSVVLALKIAELTLLEKNNKTKPILLLDDVFSELDGKRRRTLAETLQKYQTFITTTDADVVIDHFSKSCNIIPL